MNCLYKILTIMAYQRKHGFRHVGRSFMKSIEDKQIHEVTLKDVLSYRNSILAKTFWSKNGVKIGLTILRTS